MVFCAITVQAFDQSTTGSKTRHTVYHISLVSGVSFQITKILKFCLPSNCISFKITNWLKYPLLSDMLFKEIKSVFRTHSNIYDEIFSENSKCLLCVSNFRKKALEDFREISENSQRILKEFSLNSLEFKCKAEVCWMVASEMTSHDAESSFLINDITYVKNLKCKDDPLFNTHFVSWKIFENIIPCNDP